MNNRSHLDDPTYWRNLAKEVRILADQVSNVQAGNYMLRIAEDYERLAEIAETKSERR